jgi:hypothetical protein
MRGRAQGEGGFPSDPSEVCSSRVNVSVSFGPLSQDFPFYFVIFMDEVMWQCSRYRTMSFLKGFFLRMYVLRWDALGLIRFALPQNLPCSTRAVCLF